MYYMNFDLISPKTVDGFKYQVKFKDPITIKKNSKIYLNFATFTRDIKINLDKGAIVRITNKYFDNVDSIDEEVVNETNIIFPSKNFLDNTPLEFDFKGSIPRGTYQPYELAKEVERIFNECIRNNKNLLFYYRPTQINFNINNLYNFDLGLFQGNENDTGNFAISNFKYKFTANPDVPTYRQLNGKMRNQIIIIGADTYLPEITRDAAGTNTFELSAYAVTNIKYFHYQRVIREEDLSVSENTPSLINKNLASPSGVSSFLNSNYIEILTFNKAGNNNPKELTGIVMVGLMPYEWAQAQAGLGPNTPPPTSFYSNNPVNGQQSFFQCPLQIVIGSGFVHLVALYPTGKTSLAEYENPITDVPDLTNSEILWTTGDLNNKLDTSNKDEKLRLFTYVKTYRYSENVTFESFLEGTDKIFFTSKQSLNNLDYEDNDPIEINYVVNDSFKTFKTTIKSITEDEIELDDNIIFENTFNYNNKINCENIAIGEDFIDLKESLPVNENIFKVGDKMVIYTENDYVIKEISSITDLKIEFTTAFLIAWKDVYFINEKAINVDILQNKEENRIYLALQYQDNTDRWITLFETKDDSNNYFTLEYFQNDANVNELRSQIPWAIVASASEKDEGFQYIQFASFDQNDQFGSGATNKKPIGIIDKYNVYFDNSIDDIIGFIRKEQIDPNVSTSLYNQEKYFVNTSMSPNVLNKTYSIHIPNLPIGNYKNNEEEQNGGFQKPILKNCPLQLEMQGNQIEVKQIYEPQFKEIFTMRNEVKNINYFDVEIKDALTDKLATEIRRSEVNFTIEDSE